MGKHFLLFFFVGFLIGQNQILKSITDDGKILTSNNKTYLLAGVNLISVKNPNVNLAEIAINTNKELEKVFAENDYMLIYDNNLFDFETIYLFHNKENINYKLLIEGKAILNDFSNFNCIDELKIAEDYAKVNRAGIWKSLKHKYSDIDDQTRKLIIDSLSLALNDSKKIADNMYLKVNLDSKNFKLVDNNLIHITNSKLIKLKNLDMPSVFHPNEKIREYSLKVISSVEYELNVLKPQIILSDTELNNNDFYYAELAESRKSHNIYRVILEQGYGKINIKADSAFMSQYKEYETTAKNMKRGIWKIIDDDYIELDPFLTVNDVLIQKKFIADSLTTDPEAYKFHLGNYLGATTIGTLGGAVGFAIGGIITSGILMNNHNNRGFEALAGIFIGGAIGSLAGSSLSLYWHAKRDNTNVSYGNILLMNLGGSLVMAGYFNLVSELNNNRIPPTAFYLGLIIPAAVGALYANVISPPLYENISPKHQRFYLEKGDKDPLKKFSSIELFRMNF